MVTGYSLGGALATITAFNVVDQGYQTTDKVYLLSYGSPRVGNGQFSDFVNQALMYKHRVVNEADPGTINFVPA